MRGPLRIGTRDSQLAVWQATWVQELLKQEGVSSELVYIKSEGDLDTVTPLYALGVTGVFTKTLDAALLNNRIDIAVHSMKDVPVQLAQGIIEAAVLPRASHKDILVYKKEEDLQKLGFENGKWIEGQEGKMIVGTGSVRRIAQWLNRYPNHSTESLRGNVNTRLRKLDESNWNGAIFAAAGLERINLRPQNSIDLDWMLPAPAQGAVMIVCRESDAETYQKCAPLNDELTRICTYAERQFLQHLMGGCSTPISALARIEDSNVIFEGNVISVNGKEKVAVSLCSDYEEASTLGARAAEKLMQQGAQPVLEEIRKKGFGA